MSKKDKDILYSRVEKEVEKEIGFDFLESNFAGSMTREEIFQRFERYMNERASIERRARREEQGGRLRLTRRRGVDALNLTSHRRRQRQAIALEEARRYLVRLMNDPSRDIDKSLVERISRGMGRAQRDE